MAYLLALGSAALYGAADFLGGLASRQTNTITIVVTSQGAGLALLLLILPLLPLATPTVRDLIWGGTAGLAGGTGVALLYRALAVGRMTVVAPTTAVCAVIIPVAAGVLVGERLTLMTALGIALAIVAIVLVSQQETAASATVRAGALPPGVGIALASGVAIGLFFLALAETAARAGMWPLVPPRSRSSPSSRWSALGRCAWQRRWPGSASPRAPSTCSPTHSTCWPPATVRSASS